MLPPAAVVQQPKLLKQGCFSLGKPNSPLPLCTCNIDWVSQCFHNNELGELKLGELLDTPPPGMDEAIAISKVMQFVESPEYSMFTRIVFDTAPTVRSYAQAFVPARLLGCINRQDDEGENLKFEFELLKKKLASATSAIKSVFGKEETRQDASDKLEQLRERMAKVRDLFRNPNTTEFVIVTIPTVMAVSESMRLFASLKKEHVPVQRLVVNQVLPPSTSECKFCEMKRKNLDCLNPMTFIMHNKILTHVTVDISGFRLDNGCCIALDGKALGINGFHDAWHMGFLLC
ncbi:ATPase ASNA1-like [Vitis vinifera]|uniref:ATPase ASNA1-like n=1 Tax=Vitis vinifera TaxID=29760 RepID=A0A438CGN4_VITVI|nr:ATPase ASNA1-like [Vitis vinifera]